MGCFYVAFRLRYTTQHAVKVSTTEISATSFMVLLVIKQESYPPKHPRAMIVGSSGKWDRMTWYGAPTTIMRVASPGKISELSVLRARSLNTHSGVREENSNQTLSQLIRFFKKKLCCGCGWGHLVGEPIALWSTYQQGWFYLLDRGGVLITCHALHETKGKPVLLELPNIICYILHRVPTCLISNHMTSAVTFCGGCKAPN